MKTGAAVYIPEQELRQLEVASSFLGDRLEMSTGDLPELLSAKEAVNNVIAKFYKARTKVNASDQKNEALCAAWHAINRSEPKGGAQ
jgi:hypothetical protein